MCTLLDPDFEDEFEFDDEDFDWLDEPWESDDWALNLNIPTMNCGSYEE